MRQAHSATEMATSNSNAVLWCMNLCASAARYVNVILMHDDKNVLQITLAAGWENAPLASLPLAVPSIAGLKAVNGIFIVSQ